MFIFLAVGDYSPDLVVTKQNVLCANMLLKTLLLSRCRALYEPPHENCLGDVRRRLPDRFTLGIPYFNVCTVRGHNPGGRRFVYHQGAERFVCRAVENMRGRVANSCGEVWGLVSNLNIWMGRSGIVTRRVGEGCTYVKRTQPPVTSRIFSDGINTLRGERGNSMWPLQLDID